MLESPDLTQLLARVRTGDARAEADLFQFVYSHLRERARRMLSREAPCSTLGSGTLVHDVYLKLFRGGSALNCQDRAHFYLLASRAMRRVIIDQARKRNAHRRGGGIINASLDDLDPPQPQGNLGIEEVIAVSEVCDRLAASKPLLEQAIQLHFFGGMSVAEIADLLEMSESTIENRLKLAKAFLHRELTRKTL